MLTLSSKKYTFVIYAEYVKTFKKRIERDFDFWTFIFCPISFSSKTN